MRRSAANSDNSGSQNKEEYKRRQSRMIQAITHSLLIGSESAKTDFVEFYEKIVDSIVQKIKEIKDPADHQLQKTLLALDTELKQGGNGELLARQIATSIYEKEHKEYKLDLSQRREDIKKLITTCTATLLKKDREFELKKGMRTSAEIPVVEINLPEEYRKLEKFKNARADISKMAKQIEKIKNEISDPDVRQKVRGSALAKPGINQELIQMQIDGIGRLEKEIADLNKQLPVKEGEQKRGILRLLELTEQIEKNLESQNDQQTIYLIKEYNNLCHAMRTMNAMGDGSEISLDQVVPVSSPEYGWMKPFFPPEREEMIVHMAAYLKDKLTEEAMLINQSDEILTAAIRAADKKLDDNISYDQKPECIYKKIPALQVKDDKDKEKVMSAISKFIKEGGEFRHPCIEKTDQQELKKLSKTRALPGRGSMSQASRLRLTSSHFGATSNVINLEFKTEAQAFKQGYKDYKDGVTDQDNADRILLPGMRNAYLAGRFLAEKNPAIDNLDPEYRKWKKARQLTTPASTEAGVNDPEINEQATFRSGLKKEAELSSKRLQQRNVASAAPTLNTTAIILDEVNKANGNNERRKTHRGRKNLSTVNESPRGAGPVEESASAGQGKGATSRFDNIEGKDNASPQTSESEQPHRRAYIYRDRGNSTEDSSPSVEPPRVMPPQINRQRSIPTGPGAPPESGKLSNLRRHTFGGAPLLPGQVNMGDDDKQPSVDLNRGPSAGAGANFIVPKRKPVPNQTGAGPGPAAGATDVNIEAPNPTKSRKFT